MISRRALSSFVTLLVPATFQYLHTPSDSSAFVRGCASRLAYSAILSLAAAHDRNHRSCRPRTLWMCFHLGPPQHRSTKEHCSRWLADDRMGLRYTTRHGEEGRRIDDGSTSHSAMHRCCRGCANDGVKASAGGSCDVGAGGIGCGSGEARIFEANREPFLLHLSISCPPPASFVTVGVTYLFLDLCSLAIPHAVRCGFACPCLLFVFSSAFRRNCTDSLVLR
ncbi:hypothetical protein R3P38DRAFT_414894 [Favolaschia claudopus]|uniref:Secreted protein n=1 Tax=Favolaschia claudopus TaxID=2862362 RepID=A0AAV9ZGM3_9AGAR